jgi:hypothetical protein
MCNTGNYAILAWWNLIPGGTSSAVRCGFATKSISTPKVHHIRRYPSCATRSWKAFRSVFAYTISLILYSNILFCVITCRHAREGCSTYVYLGLLVIRLTVVNEE